MAAAVADLVVEGDLIVLDGDLGAGKTCFAQGLGQGLGVPTRITSPTFTIVAEHEGRLSLHHLDAYRLSGADEAGDLDLPELLERGVTVVEWGSRLAPALPADHLHIELSFGAGDDDRRLCFSAGPAWAARRGELAAALAPWTDGGSEGC